MLPRPEAKSSAEVCQLLPSFLMDCGFPSLHPVTSLQSLCQRACLPPSLVLLVELEVLPNKPESKVPLAVPCWLLAC